MILLFLALFGCAAEDPCASRRDLLTSPAGLDLTPEEHPDGWGHADCFECHQRWEIHRYDCIDGVEVDTEALQAVEECQSCHGYNGVEAWLDQEETP